MEEFIKFLKKIDRIVKKRITLPVIMNNYATHKTAEVKAELEKHKRFKVYFIATRSSWLNLVERFFADITHKHIRRGVFSHIELFVASMAIL